jgi:hypothetical protein
MNKRALSRIARIHGILNESHNTPAQFKAAAAALRTCADALKAQNFRDEAAELLQMAENMSITRDPWD